LDWLSREFPSKAAGGVQDNPHHRHEQRLWTRHGETLARAGHTVYASMRGVKGKNRDAAEALQKLGVKTVELDVDDDASVEAGDNPNDLHSGPPAPGVD
jgi:hypothetical protein